MMTKLLSWCSLSHIIKFLFIIPLRNYVFVSIQSFIKVFSCIKIVAITAVVFINKLINLCKNIRRYLYHLQNARPTNLKSQYDILKRVWFHPKIKRSGVIRSLNFRLAPHMLVTLFIFKVLWTINFWSTSRE